MTAVQLTEILWQQQASWPLLSMLQWLPLLGAIVVLVLGERTAAVAIGRIVALAELEMGIPKTILPIKIPV